MNQFVFVCVDMGPRFCWFWSFLLTMTCKIFGYLIHLEEFHQFLRVTITMNVDAKQKFLKWQNRISGHEKRLVYFDATYWNALGSYTLFQHVDGSCTSSECVHASSVRVFHTNRNFSFLFLLQTVWLYCEFIHSPINQSCWLNW